MNRLEWLVKFVRCSHAFMRNGMAGLSSKNTTLRVWEMTIGAVTGRLKPPWAAIHLRPLKRFAAAVGPEAAHVRKNVAKTMGLASLQHTF